MLQISLCCTIIPNHVCSSDFYSLDSRTSSDWATTHLSITCLDCTNNNFLVCHSLELFLLRWLHNLHWLLLELHLIHIITNMLGGMRIQSLFFALEQVSVCVDFQVQGGLDIHQFLPM